MTLDNHQRAVLTIAALTQLVETTRRLAPDDATGRNTMRLLEGLVINGSVTERDEILHGFAKDASFAQVLAAKDVRKLA
jgi:hypothetical protein